MYVCMFSIGTRTVGATGLKFGMELGFNPRKVLANVWAGWTPLPGRGMPRSASGGPPSPNRAFPGKLYKIKVEGHPRFSVGWSRQMRSRTSPRGLAASPSARGRSAAVVIGPIELKLGRCFTLMGTWPQKCFGHIGPQPPGQGWPGSGSGGPYSQNWAFLGKLYKRKTGEHP